MLTETRGRSRMSGGLVGLSDVIRSYGYDGEGAGFADVDENTWSGNRDWSGRPLPVGYGLEESSRQNPMPDELFVA